MSTPVEAFETRLARTEQRVSDLDNRMTAMIPMTTTVIQLAERVDILRRDLASYAGDLKNLEEEITKRDAATRTERRQARYAMWSLTIMILCALIGAAAVILTSGGVR